MHARSELTETSLPSSPADVLRRWRRDLSLCLLHSPPADRPECGRIVAANPRGWLIVDSNRRAECFGDLPAELADAGEADAVDLLDRLLQASSLSSAKPDGTWMVALSYDLGRVIEPVAQHVDPARRARDDRSWPLIAMAWCPDRLILEQGSGTGQLVGDRDTVASWFADVPSRLDEFYVQSLTSSFTKQQYLETVRCVKEKIAAGDIFQANLTQRFTAPCSGSTRELACRAFAHSQPRYGGYLELPGGRCVVSMSPELFLEVDGKSRAVVTRPIKGTRPATQPDATEELRDSIKDRAELNMIVDLMRNDLGRVCEYGSIAVTEPRLIETHPTVHHGVSTIRGGLRDDVSIAGLLRATFPGGSITGAPKIRAMQIIDAIEPIRRGAYCGSIGWVAPDQSARLNIAIRTICLTGERAPGDWANLIGLLDYGAGGGIVADSDPMSEYRESIDKAAVLRLALQSQLNSVVQA